VAAPPSTAVEHNEPGLAHRWQRDQLFDRQHQRRNIDARRPIQRRRHLQPADAVIDCAVTEEMQQVRLEGVERGFELVDS
jgi:hypothetical protein